MFNDQELEQIRKIVSEMLRHQPKQKVMQSDIPPQTIKRRHLEDVVVVFGLAADRPTDDSTGISSYFSTDTGVFACWDGSAWLETTLA